MDPTRVAKRPRIGTPGEQVPHVERSVLWYPDGNVVLQAELVQFRVHKSIVSQHSTVFNDMFTIGTSDGTNLVDGCDVVVLHDAAEDVEILMKTIYNTIQYFDTEVQLPLKTVSAVIRLGKKYDMRDFYVKAAACLTKEFPTYLLHWKNLQNRFSKLKYYHGMDFDLVRLAHQADLPSILPFVLFRCGLHYNFEELLRGISSQDHPVSPLDSDVIGVCLRGWNRLCEASSSCIRSWALECTEPDGFNCASGRKCTKAVRHCALRALDNARPIRGHCSFEFVTQRWEEARAAGLCDPCTDAYREHWDVMRASVFQDLPGFYDLPGWDDLDEQSRINYDVGPFL